MRQFGPKAIFDCHFHSKLIPIGQILGIADGVQQGVCALSQDGPCVICQLQA